jgi:hypothetical protein
MASIIDASTAGVGGIITTADNSGNLNIQSGGSTKIAVTSAGVTVTGLAKASLPTGSVLQVVSATYATETGSSSSTFIDTGLTATITPTSSTSKILVLVSQNGCGKQTNDTALRLKLLRGATDILYFSDIAGRTNTTAANYIGSISASYLDSPATTSATTYKTQFSSLSGNGIVIVQGAQSTAVSSSITLMEIAA